MTTSFPKQFTWGVALMAGLAMLAFALPRVFAQGTVETIIACKLNTTGALRAVDSAGNCNGLLETVVEWQVAPESGTTFPLMCGGCNFQGIQIMQGRDLSESWLFSTNLSWGNFTDTNFSGANLGSSSVSYANFENANFTNANLSGMIDLATATTTGVIWDNTICPDDTNSNDNSNTCAGHF